MRSGDDPGSSGPGPSVILVFFDGLGLAPAGADNPLSRVPMPHVQRLLGGPLILETVTNLEKRPAAGDLVMRAVDAGLGVPGLPQSATGQTALFTGLNAPALMGEHITAHPTAALREIIAEHSLLKRASERGARVLFANAHSERFWEMVRNGRRRLGASTLTAMAAGVPICTLDDLAQGRAVLWDITHEIASGHLEYDLPHVPAAEAGARLARLAGEHDLVLYESFLPDLAGHRRIEPEWVLPRLDEMLGGLVAHRLPGTTLVLSSDHGNMEDSSVKAHTANPVPLLAVGPGAHHFERATAITDVAPAILALLFGTGDGRDRHNDED